MVADLDLGDLRAGLGDHAGYLVAQDDGELTADERGDAQVRVAQAGRLHLDADLVSDRVGEVDVLHDETLAQALGDRCLHDAASFVRTIGAAGCGDAEEKAARGPVGSVSGPVRARSWHARFMGYRAALPRFRLWHRIVRKKRDTC